ncbi:3125_t:CDS:2 [Acaulospora colombiana]|uniref:3125_t:CDS:1 n=1 Tax=Acaulospora colombiana TaxID=27376 RepID=A0ACA9LFT4_9GLOM|nr:3125_t:CDS:2 [Acaulospora colombiana]
MQDIHFSSIDQPILSSSKDTQSWADEVNSQTTCRSDIFFTMDGNIRKVSPLKEQLKIFELCRETTQLTYDLRLSSSSH